MLTSAKGYRSAHGGGRFAILALGLALGVAYPGSDALTQSPPASPGSTYAPSPLPAQAPAQAPSPASSAQPAPVATPAPAVAPPQRLSVPLPPERTISPSAGLVPDGRLECGWVGTRIISMLIRDDIDGGNQYFHFFSNFGCASEHLAQAFRCTVGGGPELAGAPLNDRINGCWTNPGMSRPLIAPAARVPAEGQPSVPTAAPSARQSGERR